MNVKVEGQEFEFSIEWLVNFIKRILEDVFGFIAEEEEWPAE